MKNDDPSLTAMLLWFALAVIAASCSQPATRAKAPPLPPTPRAMQRLTTAPRVILSIVATPPQPVFNGGPQPGTNLVPHEASFDADANRLKVIWPSAPGQKFIVWWTEPGGVAYPVDYYHTNILVGTNWQVWPVYPPVTAVLNTNRTWVYFDWPTNAPVVFAVSKIP